MKITANIHAIFSLIDTLREKAMINMGKAQTIKMSTSTPIAENCERSILFYFKD